SDQRADGRLISLVTGGTADSPGGSNHLTIEHNTMIGTGPGLWLDHGAKRTDGKNRGAIIRDNVVVGRGGIQATDLGEGQVALDAYFTDDLVFRGNDIVGGKPEKYGRFTSFGFFSQTPPPQRRAAGSRDAGVRDWSSAGLGMADAASDPELD